MTFKDHALSSAGDPTDSDRPLSSVPRDCTPFMLSLLIWQAHTTRAPTVFRQSRRNLCAGPSRRGRRPAPPSVQISDAGSTSSPCFSPCTNSGPTSSSTLASVMGGRDGARKALYLKHPVSGWLGPASGRFFTLLGTPGPRLCACEVIRGPRCSTGSCLWCPLVKA